jgi:hypothetical protein
VAASFGIAIQTFEKTWYGTFLVSEGLLEQFEDDVERLQTSLADRTS